MRLIEPPSVYVIGALRLFVLKVVEPCIIESSVRNETVRQRLRKRYDQLHNRVPGYFVRDRWWVCRLYGNGEYVIYPVILNAKKGSQYVWKPFRSMWISHYFKPSAASDLTVLMPRLPNLSYAFV